MTRKVERLITIAAPPERVWKAWVEEMNAWWTKPYYNDHDRVTGLLLEPRLGGRYIEEWGENGEGFLIGQVTEWLPPARLAYTWSRSSWPQPDFLRKADSTRRHRATEKDERRISVSPCLCVNAHSEFPERRAAGPYGRLR